MTTTVSVTDARAILPELLDRVRSGEEVTLTRHGEPVAVLVRPDTLRTRRAERAFADAQRLHEVLAKGRDVPLGVRPGISAARAEELVADVQASRSKR